jgi:hypothetical protein
MVSELGRQGRDDSLDPGNINDYRNGIGPQIHYIGALDDAVGTRLKGGGDE